MKHKRTTAVLAAVTLAAIAGGTAACSSSSPPPACTPASQVNRWLAQTRTYLGNAADNVPVPAGAAWPQKAADLAANPQVTDAPWDQGAVNSLYWDRQLLNADAVIRHALAARPACPAAS